MVCTVGPMSRRVAPHVPVLVVLAIAVAFPRSLVAEPAAIVPIEIEDPTGRALERFFAALRRTASKQPGAITRIAHYGDSLIVGDGITRSARRRFQARYGDAGPGFVLAGRPWDWYRREGVRLGGSTGWDTYRSLSGGPADRFFGFGGSTFVTRREHQRVWFETTEIEGRRVKASSIEVHYLAHPRGGDLDVLVDGDHVLTIATKRDETVSAFHTVRVPEGPHKVVLRTVGNGQVRLFGVVLERDGPGIVYDSLGINGASTDVLGRMDPVHMEQQLGHRRPDLVIVGFGANESNRPGLVDRYREEVLPVLRRLRHGSRDASCLVVGPIDRGVRDDRRGVRSHPIVMRISRAQREVSRDAGCGFYDTFAVMGGEGAAQRWHARGLTGGDLVHPTPEGSDLLGQVLFEALERAFTRYRATSIDHAPARRGGQ